MRIEIRGTQAVLGDLDRISLDNLDMGEVAAYLEREHRLYYAEEAGPDGAWAALAPSTLAQKKSGAILRETGAMAAGTSSEAGKLEARVFNAGPKYAQFHQTGTSRMPQREIIGFRPYHPDRIEQMIRRQLGL